jgi:hypothetical protein
VDLAVVVAVVTVRVMQVAVHQVIDVIAVRHRLMAAAGAMLMRRVVGAAGVLRRAGAGVGAADFQLVVLDTGLAVVVQVAVVQVIDVVAVLDRRVAAIRAVLVVVFLVVGGHVSVSFAPLGGRLRLQLVGVGQRVVNQIGDVPIRQCVKQVRPLPATHDQPFAPQQPEPLRHRREFLSRRLDDFGNTPLPLSEQRQNAQAGRVPHRAEELSRAFQGSRLVLRVVPLPRSMILGSAPW